MSHNSQPVSSADPVKMVVKSNQASSGNVQHIATIGKLRGIIEGDFYLFSVFDLMHFDCLLLP